MDGLGTGPLELQVLKSVVEDTSSSGRLEQYGAVKDRVRAKRRMAVVLCKERGERGRVVELKSSDGAEREENTRTLALGLRWPSEISFDEGPGGSAKGSRA